MVFVINCMYFYIHLKALAEEASEDELPSDVDLNDPYFAEEITKIGKPAHIWVFNWNLKKGDMGGNSVNYSFS